jgi:drug/metabolite transporter (DMT)-like permease
MSWIVLALLAHGLNAVVFLVDKGLLTASPRFAQPLRYTFFSGVLAGVSVVLLPWVNSWPSGFILGWSAVATIVHLPALWLLYWSLRHGDPARLVPIVGSVVPVATWLLAVSILGETFSSLEVVAVVLLIGGGALLGLERSRQGIPAARLLGAAVVSGVCFAAYFTVLKQLYTAPASFLTVFVYSRLFEAFLVLVFVGPWFVWRARAAKSHRQQPRVSRGIAAPVLFMGNKGIAAGAFILQNYAISLGSVTVVNALQGTQYAFLFLLGLFLHRWWPSIFTREESPALFWQKLAGVVCCAVGLGLLVGV